MCQQFEQSTEYMLDDIDLSSQDVAIEIERGLTKDRWFLQAHIAS